MKYQTYPNYKPSGVEWLGDVPEHWFSTKIKYGYKITLGKMLQKDSKQHGDELKPYLKAINIQSSGVSIETIEEMYFSTVELKSLRLLNGDVLISEGGDVGRAAIWKDELPECYIQNAIHRVRSLTNTSSRFLYYWIGMLKDSDFIDTLCNKATISHYTVDKLEFSPLFIPKYNEAEKIANFLDHETAKIDTLIDKQQRLIALLKEKRQAVISHAVTKGLNPNAPMKPSGVEWLGDVPVGWEVLKISYIAILKSGDGITSEQIEETGTYPVYGGNGLRGYSESFNHNGDYILIGRQGALCGNINYGYGKFWASEHAVVVHPIIPLNFKWLGETLRAMNLNQYNVSAAQPGLAVANIICLKIPFPIIEEQNNIQLFIENENAKIDTLIEKSNSAIELMQERRTALISAAVTGKIDVRDWGD